ncbi:MAG: helix-turn-helix domain-containing protein [Clostridiales bacterium]|nr:helix-turn-helix domain-containing protein [Eubacteriales bacterium]MDH7566033.1 helix-turn-helix domain-containing protein [Clostridiales bacterium]
MKMTLKWIAEKLLKYNPEIRISDGESITIRTIMLLKNAQQSFEPDVLYFGKASDLPKYFSGSSPVNVACVADRYFPKRRYTGNSNLNLIILKNHTDIVSVFNEMQELLSRNAQISDYKEKLMECLFAGNGMQNIVDTAYQLLGNPLMIVDVGHKYIASSVIETEDSFWEEAFKRKYVASDIVLMLKNSEEIRKIFRSKTPVIFNTHVSTRELLSNVFIGQKIVARISVYELYREFNQEDMEVVSYLSHIVSLEMQKSKYSYINKGQMFEYFLNDLLEDKISDDNEISERVKYIDLPMKPYNCVFTIDLSHKKADYPVQAEIMDEISLLIPDSISIFYNANIVTLISGDSINDVSESSMEKMELYLKNMDLVGGISLCFSYIGDFKKYYLQSLMALRLRSHISSRKILNRYEDYFFHHIADICSKIINLTSLCHPSVLRIWEYDKKNGSDLLKTLFFYLKYDRSITETANVLHIHRNTLDYRISKIKGVIDLDWNNFDVIKQIYMSLRMLEYMEHISFEG